MHPGGGDTNDPLGVSNLLAVDTGAVTVVMPGDRIATTILFTGAAEGGTSEALHQRAMHKHTLILQGAFGGEFA